MIVYGFIFYHKKPVNQCTIKIISIFFRLYDIICISLHGKLYNHLCLLRPKYRTLLLIYRHIYLCIKYLPPPLNYLRTFCINYFYNLLYVFYLQHISVCSFCNSYLRNNINNSYKYLPCCSNKYIFIICKNKFEKHNHPVFCSLIWVGFKKQENSFIKLLKKQFETLTI